MQQLSGDKMITREQITRILEEQRAYLRTEFGVEKIGLFGSYGKGTAYAGSDIDLVIEFALPIGFRFVELAEYLETLLDAPVDILTPAGLEGIRVPQVASEIQDSVVYV
jgi:predicted nucleotidyltransferase